MSQGPLGLHVPRLAVVSLQTSRSPPGVQSILPEQRLLEDPAKQEAVLAYLPDPNMRDRLRNRWSHLPEIGQDISVARWQQLEREADKVSKLWRVS